MFISLAILAGLVLAINLACTVFLTPGEPVRPVAPRSLYRLIARAAYGIAYGLALLRIPYGVIPYGCKLAVFVLARPLFERFWRTDHRVQMVRLLGDFANWFLTTGLMALAASRLPSGFVWTLVSLSAAAEAIRLTLEKGQMLISAGWQTLPHRRIASALAGWLDPPGWVDRYRAYYALGDGERLAAVLGYARARAACDPATLRLIEYTRDFRIVPDDHSLEAGLVRDVAAGEVFVHRGWSADPWLLVGLALRRGAWLFDPRYLRRPFTYRTESNRLATLVVLGAAAYSPPYALYQLGHEIKAARYHVYHSLCRLVGWNNELFVLENGLYPFERIIGWLSRLLRHAPRPARPPLWSDDQVVEAVLAAGGDIPAAAEIARRYVYPLCYVEDVLLRRIEARRGEE